MNYLLLMLMILMAGSAVLVVGIVIAREPGQSMQSALNDSFVWSIGFFISFGTEFMVLANR